MVLSKGTWNHGDYKRRVRSWLKCRDLEELPCCSSVRWSDLTFFTAPNGQTLYGYIKIYQYEHPSKFIAIWETNINICMYAAKLWKYKPWKLLSHDYGVGEGKNSEISITQYVNDIWVWVSLSQNITMTSLYLNRGISNLSIPWENLSFTLDSHSA